MSSIEFSVNEFEELMNDISKVDMDEDEYIPSIDDVLDYVEKHPERYYKYLLWFSEHKPQPKTEEEKTILKRITKIINNTVIITDETDEDDDNEEEGV